MPASAPIIVTALFGAADAAWLDGLRRTHYPPERNQVPAHLTLFQHLAPSLVEELGRRLTAETRGDQAPAARIAGIIKFPEGTALRVESPQLEAIRDRLADAFAPYLRPPDAAPWRPHVTIQNRVDRTVAKALQVRMAADFRPRPLEIIGLASWAYRGGPWQPIGRHLFSRSGRSPRN
ncbi:2'-5' RNA ligase family protein [Sphingomonas sp. DBB INV C78]|uniref:2'-5' RNA ligase family protein n=1 Tax=Sphingomonas sp. DBB INV C78 TaxID=3349434 RepID=UPI0036D2D8E5